MAAVEAEQERLESRRQELGVQDDLVAAEGLTLPMAVALGENGVKTLDDLADLASDELREYLPTAGLDEDQANTIIMAARAHWFADEESGEAASGEEADDGAGTETAG